MNLSDKLAALARATVGAIPYAGPALSEIICVLIPNQRLDRAAAYLRAIDHTVQTLAQSIQSDRSKLNLIEAGLKAAVGSSYGQKCQWIANVVNKGLGDEVEAPIAEGIVSVVEELNQEQIFLLYYCCRYSNESIAEVGKFMNRFPKFKAQHEYVKDEKQRELVENRRTLNHTKLETLGLLRVEADVPRLSEFHISSKYDERALQLLQKQLLDLNKYMLGERLSRGFEPTELGRLVIGTMMVDEATLEE